MKQRPFKQVDVFTARAYDGNPLAVVLDGSGLSTEEMQHFTNWTNLSECTFLLPPTQAGADYKVRIFCPGRELPFAGHPTLGTCHAWLEAGGKPQGEYIMQECGIGLVKIKRDAANGRLAFAAPPLIKSGALDEADVALIARGLGVQRDDIVAHAWCDNGPNWRGVMLRSAEQVLALKPDAAVLAGLDIGVVGPRGKVGVVGTQSNDNDTHFEVRAFFPGNNGMAEDPVTGSLNAGIAQWLIGSSLAPKNYVAAQGTALARAGRVHVEQIGSDIWIGGASVTCVDGKVLL
ncbi:PhzF family phenazine biosynthesis protein [Variovorax sp. PCZ-1]|uniref:PhzF family phenazine biosynthesis protein n=1 Tax=Variovorax sp. PCZ-1 TaxID=2835533 RepID=UPI001BCCD3AD|nr:PhzF family phenazine biosynthesis protein [Variovorax sp. PCZ-1]MBS7806010.1 PhzF family phenazine biosynthesis protein [Variovorax sp. PCZ-1]